jgi:hypothetical protein
MAEVNKIWVAAYLYYAEPWEEFLSKAVKPFVKEVMKKDWAEQFFFIRYWEKGPHIRLRFKTSPELAEHYLKPALNKHFESYFEGFPSERQEPKWLEEVPQDQQWFPNNSVQFIAYEPEVDRYGGPQALLVAEEHFQHASQATLEALSQAESWDYETALGTAMKMHLAFVHGFEMNRMQAAKFFEYFFISWFPRAYGYPHHNQPKEVLEQKQKETLELFKQAWGEQREIVQSFAEQMLEALEQEVAFEEDWLNDWVDNLKHTRKALENTFIEPFNNAHFSAFLGDTFENKQHDMLQIAQSYIHMINNRLGIMNREEGFLGYLLKEVLKPVTKNEKQLS